MSRSSLFLISLILGLTGLWIASLPGEVLFLTERSSFETAVTDLDQIEEGFSSAPEGLRLADAPLSLLSGNLEISLLNNTPWDDPDNRVVSWPYPSGAPVGVDSPDLDGKFLLCRVRKPVGAGDREVHFALDFGGGCHAIGFDYSGAVGGRQFEGAAHLALEARTAAGVSVTYSMQVDDGFLGVISPPDDPIVFLRWHDENPDTTRESEVFGIDTIIIGVPDASLLPELLPPFTTARLGGGEPGLTLGQSVAGPGDVDGDGTADLAVSGMLNGTGIVRVMSGATGRELYTITSPVGGFGFAEDRNLVALGDLDGDGVSELAAGIPYGSFTDPTGFFLVCRGVDGSVLRSHFGLEFETLSYEIAALGDVDGDNVPDYAASNFETGPEGGRVIVYSGAEGQELAQITSMEGVRFYSIAGPGDLDGDGRGDLVLSIWAEVNPWKRGEVRVLSGSLFGIPDEPAGALDIFSPQVQANTLFTTQGFLDETGGLFEGLGLGLNALRDLDADGVPEIGAGTGPTSDAVVFSGATGERLHEWFWGVTDLSAQFVVETATIGDLDRDGTPDVVVGLVGLVRVMSGRDGSLLAEKFGDGGFGEEIAAIGDLDGDGASELLVTAPEGGYAELISFSVDRLSYPDTPSGFEIRRQGTSVVASWKPGLTDVVLEQSTNLVHWEVVSNVMFENLYVVPPGRPGHIYYRLQFSP